MTARTLAITVDKISGNSANALDRDRVEDRVAVEEPLEIRLGYATPAGRTADSISITMRTPGFDEELAVGFLYSLWTGECRTHAKNTGRRYTTACCG